MEVWPCDREPANRYKVDEITGCWIWLGKNTGRYGQFKKDYKHISAHRYFFELHKRKLEPGEQVDHLCRNTLCVNPNHLDAVSPKENVHRGKNLKLTDQQVIAIRTEYGYSTHQEIADKYHVSRAHVTQILNFSKR